MYHCLSQKSVIGIDVGNNYVSLVKLCNKRIVDYKIVVNNDVNDALKSITNKRINNSLVVMGLRYKSILTKSIILDASLSYYEIEKYLYGNIERYFGILPQHVAIDFEIAKINRKQVSVKLIVAKRDDINLMLTLSAKANIKLRVLDVEHFALARAILSLFELSNNEQFIVIHNKEEYLLFCFIKNKQIVYTTEVKVLDNNITQLIIKELQLFLTINNLLIGKLILTGSYIEIDTEIIKEAINPSLILIQYNPFLNLNSKDEFLAKYSLFLSYGFALWRNG